MAIVQINILQQYFSQELNYEVTLHGEEGPRRFDISDKTKSERREAEENLLKKSIILRKEMRF